MFRDYTFPTLYPPIKSLDIDNFLLIFWYFSGSIILSFIIILPGVRGKQRIYTFLYGSFSLITGVLIIACNYSYNWEFGSIVTKLPYKVGSSRSILCRLKLDIGLRGFNVSLQELRTPDKEILLIYKLNQTYEENSQPFQQVGLNIPEKDIPFEIEPFYYNEAFRWNWEQGNQLPNSPLANHLIKDYHAAQLRGAPLPVLWVAQYFTIDSETFRWGRHYRLAGYYTHILLWLAFPCWILANILIYICIKYSGYFWITTGFSLIGADCVYWLLHCLPPLNTLSIKFPEAVLELTFGAAFWITFYIGVLSVFVGMAIILADARYYNQLMAFFGIDVLQEYEDYFADPVELGLEKRGSSSTSSSEDASSQKSGSHSSTSSSSLPSSISTKSPPLHYEDRVQTNFPNLIKIPKNMDAAEETNVDYSTSKLPKLVENFSQNNKNHLLKNEQRNFNEKSINNVHKDHCTIQILPEESQPFSEGNERRLKTFDTLDRSAAVVDLDFKMKLKPMLTSPLPLSVYENEVLKASKLLTVQPERLLNRERNLSTSCSLFENRDLSQHPKKHNSPKPLIPVLRKRGTAHSFFFRKKCANGAARSGGANLAIVSTTPTDNSSNLRPTVDQNSFLSNHDHHQSLITNI